MAKKKKTVKSKKSDFNPAVLEGVDKIAPAKKRQFNKLQKELDKLLSAQSLLVAMLLGGAMAVILL